MSWAGIDLLAVRLRHAKFVGQDAAHLSHNGFAEHEIVLGYDGVKEVRAQPAGCECTDENVGVEKTFTKRRG